MIQNPLMLDGVSENDYIKLQEGNQSFTVYNSTTWDD